MTWRLELRVQTREVKVIENYFPTLRLSQGPEVPLCPYLFLFQENIYPLMISENRAQESELERCSDLCQNSTLAIKSPTGWEEREDSLWFWECVWEAETARRGSPAHHHQPRPRLCAGTWILPLSRFSESLCFLSVGYSISVQDVSFYQPSYFCQQLWIPFAFEANAVELFMPVLFSFPLNHSQVSVTIVILKWLLSRLPSTCLLVNLLVRPQLSFLCPVSIPTPMT